jgi:hypothetical protein
VSAPVERVDRLHPTGLADETANHTFRFAASVASMACFASMLLAFTLDIGTPTFDEAADVRRGYCGWLTTNRLFLEEGLRWNPKGDDHVVPLSAPGWSLTCFVTRSYK